MHAFSRITLPCALLALTACNPSSGDANLNSAGDDPLVGTWSVQLIRVDDGDAIPCTAEIKADGAVSVSCDVEQSPDAAYCERETSILRVDGSVGAGAATLTVGNDRTYVGDMCDAEGVEVGRTYATTDADLEGTRTADGPGLLGGAWTVSAFDWQCNDEDTWPCDDRAGRRRDADDRTVCTVDFADGALAIVCTTGGENGALCIRGTVADGALALDVEELAEGETACGGVVEDQEIRIEATRN